MNKKKSNRGGKRIGAGKPPLPQGERKKAVTVYAKEKYIDKCGGTEQAKQIALKAIHEANK